MMMPPLVPGRLIAGAERVGVGVGVGLGVGVGVGVGVGGGVGRGEVVGDGDGDGVGVGGGVGVGVGTSPRDGRGVRRGRVGVGALGVGVGVDDARGVGVGVGVSGALADGVGVGVADALGDGVGVGVGDALGEGVGVGAGVRDGVGVGVALRDGVGVGVGLGVGVGVGVGRGPGSQHWSIRSARHRIKSNSTALLYTTGRMPQVVIVPIFSPARSATLARGTQACASGLPHSALSASHNAMRRSVRLRLLPPAPPTSVAQRSATASGIGSGGCSDTTMRNVSTIVPAADCSRVSHSLAATGMKSVRHSS